MFKISNLPKLQRVLYSANDIYRIPKNYASGLLRSYELVMVMCKICEITKELSMETWKLPFNNITEFKPEWFSEPSRFRKLDLRINFISYLPRRAFKKFTSLEYIDLKINRLTHIGPEAFTGRSYFTHIDLSSNNLNELPSNMFHSTTISVKDVFNTRYNKLTCLAQNILNTLIVENPHVDMNPWECSCICDVIIWASKFDNPENMLTDSLASIKR